MSRTGSSQNIRSLSEKTADRIIQMIIDRGLAKGAKLDNERVLCEALGVGRSTLREAVRMLASRNILKVLHGSGIYVSDKLGIPDDPLGFTFVNDKKKLVYDLLDFRRIVEPPICSMAALYAGDEEIARLKECSDEVDRLISEGQPHIEADMAFHSQIGIMSRNSVMPKIEPIIFNAISLFVKATNSGLLSETISDHHAIWSAIARHDPLRASDAMLLHIIHNRDMIEKLEGGAARPPLRGAGS